MASMVRKKGEQDPLNVGRCCVVQHPRHVSPYDSGCFATRSAAIVDAMTLYDSRTASGSWVSGIVSGIVQAHDVKLDEEDAGICGFARRGRVA